MKNIIILSFVLLASILYSTGQTYNNPGGTISTCSGTFYDSGGSGSNYSNNQNTTTTLCSSVPGQCLQVNFTSFSLENTYDFLYIYDGPTTASNLLGTYTGGTSPGTVTSSTGCLTFRFTSDFSVTAPGWAATVSCGACPTVPDYTQPIAANAGGEKVGACLVTHLYR